MQQEVKPSAEVEDLEGRGPHSLAAPVGGQVAQYLHEWLAGATRLVELRHREAWQRLRVAAKAALITRRRYNQSSLPVRALAKLHA